MSFNGYYSTEARDGFIAAVLRPFSGWSIIPRNNPSQNYPSDFSLVQLKVGVADALSSLRHHPSIKRVTPQKKLTRMLTFSGHGELAYRACNSRCVHVCKLVIFNYTVDASGCGQSCDWETKWNSRYSVCMCVTSVVVI